MQKDKWVLLRKKGVFAMTKVKVISKVSQVSTVMTLILKKYLPMFEEEVHYFLRTAQNLNLLYKKKIS